MVRRWDCRYWLVGSVKGGQGEGGGEESEMVRLWEGRCAKWDGEKVGVGCAECRMRVRWWGSATSSWPNGLPGHLTTTQHSNYQLNHHLAQFFLWRDKVSRDPPWRTRAWNLLSWVTGVLHVNENRVCNLVPTFSEVEVDNRSRKVPRSDAVGSWAAEAVVGCDLLITGCDRARGSSMQDSPDHHVIIMPLDN